MAALADRNDWTDKIAVRIASVTSWKTTVAGLGSALFCFVLFAPEHFVQWPWLISLSKFALAGGLAALGLFSKDATVHSTAPEVNAATVQAQVAANVTTTGPAKT